MLHVNCVFLGHPINIEYWILSWSNDFRGSITVVTETGQITQSHLVIRNARKSDEGNYTCKPSIFKSAKLRLFVLNGKSS